VNRGAPLPEKTSGAERGTRIVAGLALLGLIAAGGVTVIAVSSHLPNWVGIFVIAVFGVAIPLHWEECLIGLARAFARIKQRKR
jgi:hypothetical protein